MALNDYPLTLQPGVPQSLRVPGNWFSVIKADGPVKLQLDDGRTIERVVGQGQTADYQRVTVESDTAQQVILLLGTGTSQDARASVTITNLNTTVEPANSAAHSPHADILANTTAAIAGANVNRKELRVSLPSDAAGPVYLGGAGILAGQGGLLEPGMVDYLSHEGALYAHNPNGATVTVSVLELERV